MNQQVQAPPRFPEPGDDYGVIARNISERTRRIDVLVKLDQVLSVAANRHDLAGEIVRHGWPHSRGD